MAINKIKKEGNITIDFELAGRAYSNGTFSVYIRITQNGEKLKKTVAGVFVNDKKHFNSNASFGKWISGGSKEPLANNMNEMLKTVLTSKREILLELQQSGIATKESVMLGINTANKNHSFINHTKSVIKTTHEQGNLRTSEKYQSFLNKLISFLGDVKDITFREITSEHIANFHSYLSIQLSAKDNVTRLHSNTVAGMFKLYRTLYNNGNDTLKLKLTEKPFSKVSCNIKAIDKVKLTLQEIDKLIALDITDKKLINARNYFMFAYYCGGMRCSDVLQLRWQDIKANERLIYTMSKTGKQKDIKLYPQSLAILEQYRTSENKETDYIFPLLSNTATYSSADTYNKIKGLNIEAKQALMYRIKNVNIIINKSLSTLQEKAGITTLLTFHQSRHSFSAIALKAGATINGLQDILSHSSSKITEQYAKSLDTTAQDETMDLVFGAKNDIDYSTMSNTELIKRLEMLEKR